MTELTRHNVNNLMSWQAGVPYPKCMVLQLDTAEDPRSKILHPERYAQGGPWKELRGTRWSGPAETAFPAQPEATYGSRMNSAEMQRGAGE